MVTIVSADSAAVEQIARGVVRRRLIGPERVSGAAITLDRIALSPGATMQLKLSPNSQAWMHMLDGAATFKAFYTDRLSEGQSVFLPPNFAASLSTEKGATLLYAEIPDARRLDPDFAKRTPLFIVTDWTSEPVLACEHDARKRVPLVTEDMCDTTAMKIEMVVYPKDTMAPECQHDGAATLLYIVTGGGITAGNGSTSAVKAGDVIYFPDHERHTLRASGDGDLRFAEFHTPSHFKTVWTDPGTMSAWRSTDRDILGRETLLDRNERKSFRFVFPFPV